MENGPKQLAAIDIETRLELMTLPPLFIFQSNIKVGLISGGRSTWMLCYGIEDYQEE